MKAGSTAMTQRPRDRVPSGSMLALPDPRRPDRAYTPTNFWWSFFDSTGMIYMHYVPTGHTVSKEYYVEVLREFRKRPALFKSGQWHFHQDNAPVHNTILVADYLTKMGIKTVPHRPYSPELAPCDFWLFPKLRGCRYEKIEGMKGCDEGHWHAPDGVGTVQQGHWSRRRLLRRGLEFHECTINESVHTKKSLETYLMILVVDIEKAAFGSPSTMVGQLSNLYIYIYIYIVLLRSG